MSIKYPLKTIDVQALPRSLLRSYRRADIRPAKPYAQLPILLHLLLALGRRNTSTIRHGRSVHDVVKLVVVVASNL
jgi:hypothetical protein